MSENEDEFSAVVSKRTVFLVDIEPSHVQGLGHKTVGLLLEKLPNLQVARNIKQILVERSEVI